MLRPSAAASAAGSPPPSISTKLPLGAWISTASPLVSRKITRSLPSGQLRQARNANANATVAIRMIKRREGAEEVLDGGMSVEETLSTYECRLRTMKNGATDDA